MEGRPPIDPDRQPEVAVTTVGPDYFETLGIRLIRGRGFQESDTAGSLPVAVVRPTDPVTFAAISLALLGVALLSSWLPARRATEVDPTVALRQE